MKILPMPVHTIKMHRRIAVVILYFSLFLHVVQAQLGPDSTRAGKVSAGPVALADPLAKRADTSLIPCSLPELTVINGTFLGNSSRNYYGEDPPDSLELIWKRYLGKGETTISRKLGSRTWAGAGWTGQPLMVSEDSVLYLIQGAYDHRLKKIRAQDGGLIWEYAFDDVIKGTGSLWENPEECDSSSRLVILQGSRLGYGLYLDNLHVTSYRAVSFITGKELWRLDSKWTDSYSRDVDGSALVIGDTAYIGLENSLFTVFYPDPDSARIKDGMLQPAIIRERKLYYPEDVVSHRNNVVTESSPSKLGERIYVTSGSGHVWGYHTGTGELDWDFRTGSDMDGSPVVSGDSCLLVSLEKQYIPGPGGVFKLDPSLPPDSAVRWFFPTGNKDFAGWEGGVIGTVAINDAYTCDSCLHLAAFVGIDGYLNVVDHRRTVPDSLVLGPDSLSHYPVPVSVYRKHVGPSIATPLFFGNRLVVPGYQGIYLFAYTPEAEFTLLDHFPGSFESTPFVYRKRIYVASRDGSLYCLGEIEKEH